MYCGTLSLYERISTRFLYSPFLDPLPPLVALSLWFPSMLCYCMLSSFCHSLQTPFLMLFDFEKFIQVSLKEDLNSFTLFVRGPNGFA